MKRTQIQMDEPTYRQLRERAFERGVSLAAVVREAVAAYLTGETKAVPKKGFRFVGSGRSEQRGGKPVSERHDEALDEALGR